MSYHYTLNSKYEHFKEALLDIQNIFNTNKETIHKARNELKTIEINGLKCVVKSFKVPHFINRVAYTYFRDAKVKKSYANAVRLTELDVNTPEPIGIIEFFNLGLLRESYFISLFEPYNFTIREVFHHKVEHTDSILKEFAAFTYMIHQKGIWHVDYSLGNILITQKGESYKFSLVDINRMEFKDIKSYEGLKNLHKFWPKDENDLVILATEYARLAKIDENKAVQIALHEAKLLEAKVNLKRKLKGQN